MNDYTENGFVERRKRDIGPPDGFEQRGVLERGKHTIDDEVITLNKIIHDVEKQQLSSLRVMLRIFGEEMLESGQKIFLGKISEVTVNSLRDQEIEKIVKAVQRMKK